MKKFGTILLAVLIGTLIFEIINPAIAPQWLQLIIELVVMTIFGFGGLVYYKATNKKKTA